MKRIVFMEIGGTKVGHTQDFEATTGRTAMIAEQGATVGVDVRGGTPGTRETDLLVPVNLVQEAHTCVDSFVQTLGIMSALPW